MTLNNLTEDSKNCCQVTFQLPLVINRELPRNIKELTSLSSYPILSTNPATTGPNELTFITLKNNYSESEIRQPKDTFRSRNSYFIARNLLGKHSALRLRDIKIARATATVCILSTLQAQNQRTNISALEEKFQIIQDILRVLADCGVSGSGVNMCNAKAGRKLGIRES